MVVVDGSVGATISSMDWGRTKVKVIRHLWPDEFDWPFIGQQFNRGYEACTGDWVIHCDSDYIFHEKDIPKIRQLLKENPNELAFSFYKYQFLLVDRYNLKSRTVLAVNKRLYGPDIRFDSGGDLCQPSYQGQEIKADQVREAGFPFYNYDFCFKSWPVIDKDWKRFRKAWKEYFNSDFGEFMTMMKGRFEGRSWHHIPLSDHPKYIQKRIREVTPAQFGYNMFDKIKDRIDYAKKWKSLSPTLK